MKIHIAIETFDDVSNCSAKTGKIKMRSKCHTRKSLLNVKSIFVVLIFAGFVVTHNNQCRKRLLKISQSQISVSPNFLQQFSFKNQNKENILLYTFSSKTGCTERFMLSTDSIFENLNSISSVASAPNHRVESTNYHLQI